MGKYFLIAFLFIASNSVLAQVFVNPGIKFGYQFGSDGLVFGFELSVTSIGKKAIWGVVVDYDIIKEMKRLHIGIESTLGWVGLDLGPTFAWDGKNNYTGFSIIPYGGIFVIPYANFTFLFKKGNYFELGSYLKLHLGTTNGKLN